MSLEDELIERLAYRTSERLGELSEAARRELVLAVRAHPENYLVDASDQAFSLLSAAVVRVMRSRADDEMRDDESFMQERSRRMARLAKDCAQALEVCPSSVEARLLALLAADHEPDDQLDALLELERMVLAEQEPATGSATGDAWDNIFSRGILRVQTCIARTCLDSARYRMAVDYAQRVMDAAPSDPLGNRHTCALCLARLEDEEGFEALDARFGRHGDSWQQLGRTILFYKLGRMPAARRALTGFANLCDGGPYALLRPVMVDTYLPDRPAAPPYSFEEVTLAVHEADPIICDVPDFCAWAESEGGFGRAAQNYAEHHGFGW